MRDGMAGPERCFDFAIDRGGTFTDVFAEFPDGKGGTMIRALKLLSEDPAHYRDAPREGIRRILEEATSEPHPRDRPLDTSRIRSIRMGTTVATNALLERKGERMALVITKGFRDLLHIGNQSRPNIFDLEIRCPDVLYESVVEVEEQVVLTSWLGKTNGWNVENSGEIEGETGEKGLVRTPLDEERTKEQLQGVLDAGISSIAVVLKHAAIFPQHEKRIGEIARGLGFSQVSLSHEAMQMVKMVPRGFTAAADAYLTPHIKRYISTFCSGFDAGLKDVRVLFMQSDGGLAQIDDFSGHKAILSGPAGGYVGYAVATRWEGVEPESLQIIGFDMGGTSTDVSRYDGTYAHVFESVTAGITIQAPQLDINTVAAGGGSRLFFQRGMFVVGPESAGAHPGPVCYRKGGPLTITDANLALGRIVPEHFPKIFGPNEDEALDVDGTNAAMATLTDEVNAYASKHGQSQKSRDEVAMGFIRVANETMCRPIRALTQMKGYDIQEHVLTCFGGAGGQHACSIARSLGIRTVFIHRYSSILSAVGMGVADVVHEAQKPYKGVLGEDDAAAEAELGALERAASQALQEQGFKQSQVLCTRFLNLRYDGTDVAMMTSCGSGEDYRAAFVARYRREFGFVLDREILIDDVRVRGLGRARPLVHGSGQIDKPGPLPPPASLASAYFEPHGRQPTPTFLTGHLSPGHKVPGPALLLDAISTVVVEPGCVAHVTGDRSIMVEVNPEESQHMDVGEECDPIQLAIFSHRFMSIAEQMGRALQRTSISVNIKERLDFSCALFDATGALVANAPHVPVHLGAMSEAIKFQVEYYGPGGEGAAVGLKDGDVVMSNHPQIAGGSHLPDITVITPVFAEGRIIFFVASRGHHADIGGISPGSMPPHSKSLLDEGASIVSFKLVEDGAFQEAGVTELLMAPGDSGRPGVSGTRALLDNLSDLRAQVAANNQGIRLIKQLIDGYGMGVVQAYMGHIQRNAEDSVRGMLREFSKAQGLGEMGSVEAVDRMDDGTPIKLTVTVSAREGSAVFDFEGTGPEVYGNCNAPAAVTSSAVIYAMRCLVRQDIPLNQGCLAPITIRIPPGTILSPSGEAAVCGGNVLTSQRVTDVVLKAFRAAAASQGCMNNFTFGDESMGYYETIAGGAGAGPSWHGRSGVHTHMTNTRITDPEIFERRYPVVLTEFSLREGSGGKGRWRGGDGVVREVEFLAPLTASILSERRATEPFGLLGGQAGATGVNLLRRKDGHVVNLGGKASLEVHPGDRIKILTPGGGGFGVEAAKRRRDDAEPSPHPEEKGFAMPGGEAGEAVRQSGSLHDRRLLQESA